MYAENYFGHYLTKVRQMSLQEEIYHVMQPTLK